MGNVNNLIGTRIKETRKELGLTQKQFAEKLGVSRSTIYSYEAGTHIPDALFIRNLAQYSFESADYLLGCVFK